MQFSKQALLVAAAGAASVSGLAIRVDPIFQVDNFNAGCIPHSALCAYDFSVYQLGSYEAALGGSVRCNATVFSSNGALPEIPEAACFESSRTFSVSKEADGGLKLTVSQPVTPSSNQTASHIITPDELFYEQTGASTQQRYNGPTSFQL